jgi:hypothetical protein
MRLALSGYVLSFKSHMSLALSGYVLSFKSHDFSVNVSNKYFRLT